MNVFVNQVSECFSTIKVQGNFQNYSLGNIIWIRAEENQTSVLDLHITWLTNNFDSVILGQNGKSYFGVYLLANKKNSALSFYKLPHHKPYIARLETADSNTSIFMTPVDQFPKTSSLLELAEDFQTMCIKSSSRPDGIKFPCIELFSAENPGSLNMDSPDLETVSASKTLQEIHLSMAQLDYDTQEKKPGADYLCKRPLIIDGPFLLWVTRDDSVDPSLVAYIDYQYWKPAKQNQLRKSALTGPKP